MTMATACLFIGWDRAHPGKEGEAFKWIMSEGLAALDAFKAKGFFESREMIGLTAHGGDLNGFILLFGERAKLDELRRTDEFERFSMRLGTLMTRTGVIPGVNFAGIQKVMERQKDILK
jgi:hypothetical protein